MKRLLRYVIVLMLFTASQTVSYAQDIRSVPDSVVERMKADEEFRYANDPSYWQKEKPKDNSSMLKFINFLGSPAMRVILYIVIGLIILFIIYQIAVVNNFFVFSGSKRKRKKTDDGGEELMPEDI